MRANRNPALRAVTVDGRRADSDSVSVEVRYCRREWPFGAVLVDGKTLTVNQARRLVTMLERAIGKAEIRF